MPLRQLLLTGAILGGWAAASIAGEPILIPYRIDGPTHDPANHSYWYGPFSECASVADFDGDGDLDIAAGRNWYEAPAWTKHVDFRDGARINGPETENNSEFTMDVNRDGHPDIVSSGWMRDQGAFWYENPGPEGLRTGATWKQYRIHTARAMEGVIHGDLDGDGDDDILCNHWMLVPGQGMTWLEHTDQAPWFIEHILGTEGEGHGNGLGDLNGDGRADIVTPTGWWEAPMRPAQDDWTFHADYTIRPVSDPKGRPPASHPILVYDCNGDGLADIIAGMAHDYGLAWLEQTVDSGGQRSFTQHWIETDFGQFHTMALGDINGDGALDLVTGKRLFAHHGRDISCDDPLFGFWYTIQDGRFTRHILYYNHLPYYPGEENLNPPPVGAVSMGMKVLIQDIDNDGRNDVLVPGKSGLYLFANVADAPRDRPSHHLPPESTYPTWEEWNKMPAREAAPIPRVIHGAGPAPLPSANTPRAATAVAVPQPATAPDDGWIRLFDPAQPATWRMGPDQSWSVQDDQITLARTNQDSREHNLDYIWTTQQYGDFVLDLEFQVPEQANSGVYLRTADRDDPVYTGIEVQVTNSHGSPDTHLRGTVGAIYDCQAPTINAAGPPGTWQQMRVTCQGPLITIELNGQRVIAMDLDRWTEPSKNPDGTPNKFPRAMKDFARVGYIGFQDHGRAVSYRNVRLKPLP